MLVLDKITLPFAELSLVKDNIILINYSTEEPMNVERSIQVVEAMNKLSNNQVFVAIQNMDDKYIFSTDAARFMSSQLSAESHNYAASAIVASNPAARIATTNFINFYKPIIPTRLFSSTEDALVWVEAILVESK